uniref:Uncharacterized protein n=1 Tax=Oryzias latipes TaxID=8090 RepID=A0A3B3I2F5_ORYLA
CQILSFSLSLQCCELQSWLNISRLTFLLWWRAFVWWFLVLLLAAQVTGVDRHGGFDLLLGQLHSLIKHLKEFL